MNKKLVLEYAGYLLIASIVVGLTVTALAYLMPTAKELEPAARVLLEMSGRL